MVCADAQISASNGSRVKRSSSATNTVSRRDVERLIRGVAEQIVEERAHGPPQVDARHARQQAAFPHHDRRARRGSRRGARSARRTRRRGGRACRRPRRGTRARACRSRRPADQPRRAFLLAPATRYSAVASLTISGRRSDISYMPRTTSSAPSSSGSLASMSIVPTTERDGPIRAGFPRGGDELIDQLADAPESGRARPPLEPGEVVGYRA